jgi:uncharacterized protein with ParB-like and HNH nuclease domain/predicted transport protein
MDAHKATLLQLVDGNKQFRIPIYQRTYSWRQEQCARLLEDIKTIASAPPDRSHFIGSIVYIVDGNFMADRPNSLLIIDGQQRLSTLSLMLLALRKIAKDGKDIGISAEKIGNLYLFNSNEEENTEEYIKLRLTRSDKETYKKLCLDLPMEDGDSNRVRANYHYFLSAFQSGKIDPVAAFKGIQKLQLVYIALELGRDNPQFIFESMNSTGLDLTQADLVRNFVLMGLPPDLQENIYTRHWLPMESRFGQQYLERFDEFMRTYLIVRTGSIPRQDEVYTAFKKHVHSVQTTDKEGYLQIETVVADLHDQVTHYAAIAFNKESDPDLRQAFHDIATLRADVVYPFLLELYGDWKTGLLTHNELLSLTRLTESYVFRRFLCGTPANSMNKTFASLSKGIDKTHYYRNAQAEFLKLTTSRRFPGNTETTRMLIDKDIYNTPRCTYLLEKLENHFHPKEPIRASNYTIEHVMPQTLSSEWKKRLGEEAVDIHSRLLHTLGNLTLTGYNSQLSCRPFHEKLKMTEGGFLSSPLALNRWISKQTQWGEQEILARSAELAKIVLKVWPEPDPTTLAEFTQFQSTEIESYDIDHYRPFSGPIRSIYLRLEERLLALHPAARREYKKFYIAFKLDTNFVDVIPQQSKLVLVFNLPFDQIDDPKERCRDITNIHSWGNGNVEMSLSDENEIDYAVGLAEQSLVLQTRG